MSMADPATGKILDFLSGIGLPVALAPIEGDGFLPGIRLADGRLTLDPARPFHPGDLLHEAGHLAVTEAALRPTLGAVENDPGEEMAAIAWSWAAAAAIGLDPDILFHAAGYGGGSQGLIDTFRTGGGPGVPLLVWYGMTGADTYPAMHRWLR